MKTITIRKKKVKGGNKSLYLDIYEDGKRTYEFLRLYLIPDTAPNAKSLNEQAMQKALAIKSERMLGIEEEQPKQTTITTDTMTVAEWIVKAGEEIDGMKASVTYQRQMHTILDIVTAYLKKRKAPKMRMSKMNADFVKGFLNFLRNDYTHPSYKYEKRHLKESSLNSYQNKFCTLLNMAVGQGYLQFNPFYSLETKDRIAKPKSNRSYLTKDEILAICKVNTHCDRVKKAFLFCCFTGLRISDIRRLTWNDIVETDKGEVICLQMKKTKSYVYVPLSNKAKEWLPPYKKQDADKPLFPLPTPTAIRQGVNILATKAGIDKDITFHTSRHTFATLTLTSWC